MVETPVINDEESGSSAPAIGRTSSIAVLLGSNRKLQTVERHPDDWDWSEFEHCLQSWNWWHYTDGGLDEIGLSPGFRGKDPLEEARQQALKAKPPPRTLPRGALAIGTTFEFQGGPSFNSVTGLGHGFLACLSTKGGKAPFINAVYRGTVRLQTGPDVWQGTASSILSNRNEISRSRGCENCWFSVEFAMMILPTHYSLRHGWSSGDGAMKAWEFYASEDGVNWSLYLKHENDPALNKGAYASHTWEIPQMNPKGTPIKPARYYKVVMKGPHWGGRHFMYCCGFELYGTVVAIPNVDTSTWGFDMD